jgi:hypothetical protein
MNARRLRDDRGLAALEMAILLPILVYLAFGIIDLGRVLFTHIAVQEATQEGAMFGSFVPNDPPAVRQRVMESLESPGLTSDDITVTCPSGDRIAVEVTHQVELLTPIVSDWFDGSITLDKTVTGHIYSEDACVPSP